MGIQYGDGYLDKHFSYICMSREFYTNLSHLLPIITQDTYVKLCMLERCAKCCWLSMCSLLSSSWLSAGILPYDKIPSVFLPAVSSMSNSVKMFGLSTAFLDDIQHVPKQIHTHTHKPCVQEVIKAQTRENVQTWHACKQYVYCICVLHSIIVAH